MKYELLVTFVVLLFLAIICVFAITAFVIWLLGSHGNSVIGKIIIGAVYVLTTGGLSYPIAQIMVEIEHGRYHQ